MKSKAETWHSYCESEFPRVEAALQRLSYTLAATQPHIKGERYLMQAITTEHGRKLILLGSDASGAPVVIKATSDPAGIRELTHERQCREFLTSIDFAAEVFHTPPEREFFFDGPLLISIQTYIEQPCTFLERPFEDQFFYALRAFKAQEGAHATTHKHIRQVKNIYSVRTSTDYLQQFALFCNTAQLSPFPELATLFNDAYASLSAQSQEIERYCRFLTHTDFVPHNVRIDKAGTMYSLDHSSLVFGNKHEGWARFLNFMTLYHPALERALVSYVRDNRSAEETQSLHLMRLYRLGEIIYYYLGTLTQSEGNLQTLNRARVQFWTAVLQAELTGTPLHERVRNEYIILRNQLRSEEEKQRQIGLH